MKDKLVYILILNWNGHDDTIMCLRSLLNLSYRNYVVVVIDNGSDDDSIEKINECFPNQKIVKINDNIGFGRGNNVGITYALENHADYVWLLNNDTIVFPETLKEMIQVAESGQRVGATGSVLYDMNSTDLVQAWGGGTIQFWCGRSKITKTPGPLDYLSAASMLICRSALLQVGQFDERYFLYWEDVDLCFRIRQAGYSIVVAEKSRVLHKESASLRNNSVSLDSYSTESMTRFFRDYSSTPMLTIFVGLICKLIKRLFLLQFSNVRAVCVGFLRGMK